MQCLVTLEGDCFFQSGSQLIGAGGFFHAAANAFYPGDDILCVHSLNQSADSFQVAVAATYKLDIVNLTVLQIEQNPLGAGAFGRVFVMHFYSFLSRIILRT